MNVKKIYQLLVLLLLLIGVPFSLLAQEKTVKGKITDATTGKPIQGVNVKVKNGTQNTVTMEDGGFTIKVPSSESVISISHVGYAIYEQKVGTAPVLGIALVQENNNLDEVIVVGYGTKKKSEVIGATATIKGEEIEDIPAANLGTTLKNRLPGVGVNVASGKPGATTSINIRGSVTLGSQLGSSDPLYIIDGLTLTKTDFDNLDASLVESMTFLKDAAAAVYGAAGAKGVVLITTKKGKPGKAKISYTGSYGLSDIAKVSDVLSGYDHAVMLNDGYKLQNAAATSYFSQADLDSIQKMEYNWKDAFWKPSSLTRHTLNVSGGTDKISFFAGGNYYRETGNLEELYIQKYGIRAGMNAKISSSVTANVAINADYTENKRPTYKPDQTDLSDQTMRALLLTPKWVPVYMNDLPVYYNNVNPIWHMGALAKSGTYNKTKNQGLTLNVSIDYKPTFIPGLTARVQYGKTNRQGTGKEWYVPYNVYEFRRYGNNGLLFSDQLVQTRRVSNTDRIYEAVEFQNSYQLMTSLNYARKIGKHDFSVLALAEQMEGEADNYSTFRDIAVIPNVDQFFAYPIAATTLGSASPSESGKLSYLTRVNYSYDSKYLLEFIGRYDGSANFPPDSRWGFFPAVGLGWKISEESFFRKNISFINTLKLRANAGLVGDDRIRNYQYKSRFSPTSGILLGNALTNGLDNNLIPNPYITWEKAFTQNYGLDATFLKGKLSFSLEVWKRHTYDGLVAKTTALSFTAGAIAADENYAIYDGWGVEATVGYRGVINKDWGYSVDMNFGSSNNVLIQTFQQASFTGTYQDAIGRPFGRVDGYIAKDILRTQEQVDAILAKNPNYTISGSKPRVGYLDYVDVNNDGKIDGSDVTKLRDRSSSKFGMGFNIGVTYKTFRLSTNIGLQVGGYVYYDAIAKTPPSTTQNAAAFWKDHWTPENPNAKFPAFDAPLARETSTFWERPGTQMRVNNMTLSYGMPKNISEKLGIPELRAYITGTNLWNIINPFDYKDPSSSNFINYPTLRTFTFGLNVTL
ncbi:MAG: hypothetical protein RLY89_1799 [Bacteroidota bacterium]|jgi:TonB-linked SusC/RagA family outer membrane protein